MPNLKRFTFLSSIIFIILLFGFCLFLGDLSFMAFIYRSNSLHNRSVISSAKGGPELYTARLCKGTNKMDIE